MAEALHHLYNFQIYWHEWDGTSADIQHPDKELPDRRRKQYLGGASGMVERKYRKGRVIQNIREKSGRRGDKY